MSGNMDESEKNVIKVGSRKSQLALIQTNSVISMLKSKNSGLQFEVVTMTTTGDQILDVALSKIGEKSLFTKELENALFDQRVDFVVHSLKDLPTVLPEGMAIGAVCKRDDPRDAVVMHSRHKDKKSLADLPKGSVIGTSSLRRAAQFKRNHPHLQLKDIRGNLNTRFRKLDTDENGYDALVLAAAGLDRMGWQDRISHILDPSDCLYAVSQGAMAVECRTDDQKTLELLSSLHDYETVVRVVAERAFLRTLEGGCSVPVAVHTTVENDKLSMKGGVWSIDGTQAVVDEMSTKLPTEDEPVAKRHAIGETPSVSTEARQYSCIIAENISQGALQAAEDLGVRMAKSVAKDGASEILIAAKKQTEEEILRQKAEKLAAAAKAQDAS